MQLSPLPSSRLASSLFYDENVKLAAGAALKARADNLKISQEYTSIENFVLWADLIDAIMDGNYMKCEGFIHNGVDLQKKCPEGRTPLTYACAWSMSKLALIILAMPEVESDTKCNDGWTPLMWASKTGLTFVVAALLEKKVGIDDMNKDGDTALYHACSSSNFNTALQLIEAGADVNVGGKNLLSLPEINTPSMALVKAALIARGATI